MDTMDRKQPPLRIFCGYAHEDEALFQQLHTAFAMLRRQEHIEIWHDRKMLAGTELDSEIEQQLHKADIILLLISPSFIASEYCWNKEMQWAIARHKTGEARVIPIILKPISGWEHNPLSTLLALPTNAKPITKWENSDDAFVDVINGLLKVIHQAQHEERYPVAEYSFTLTFEAYEEQRGAPRRNALIQQTEHWLERIVTGIGGTLRKVPGRRLTSSQQEWIFTAHQKDCHIRKNISSSRGFFQYAHITITSQHLMLLDQMIAEGQTPYCDFQWTLSTNLDVNTVTAQIYQRTGLIAQKLHRLRGDTNGLEYRLYSNNPDNGWLESFYSIYVVLIIEEPSTLAHMRLTCRPLTCKDFGFYHAHQLFSIRKVLSMLRGEVPHTQIEKLVEQACTPQLHVR